MAILALVVMALAAPVFGQLTTVANSTWNGGTGTWTSANNWVTNWGWGCGCEEGRDSGFGIRDSGSGSGVCQNKPRRGKSARGGYQFRGNDFNNGNNSI
jgi:hypothetical protein